MEEVTARCVSGGLCLGHMPERQQRLNASDLFVGLDDMAKNGMAIIHNNLQLQGQLFKLHSIFQSFRFLVT